MLRFDYMGNGDSDGDIQPVVAVARRWRTCSLRHRDTCRRDRRRATVSLLGLRLGATIASLVAEESPSVDRLVLWAPVVDGAPLHAGAAAHQPDDADGDLQGDPPGPRGARRSHAQSGETVNVDGYEMALPMFTSR